MDTVIQYATNFWDAWHSVIYFLGLLFGIAVPFYKMINMPYKEDFDE
jgi:hypothetical protein